MTIRFDASEDAVVEGPHPVDAEDRDGWAGDDETLWYLTDGSSNGRWLVVEEASAYYGGVPLGVLDSPGRGNGTTSGWIYRKYLSAAACRSLAETLTVAAERMEAIDAARKAERDAYAERKRQCEADGGHQWGPAPMTVTHATGVLHSDGTSEDFAVCERCGYGKWLDSDTYRAAMTERRQREQHDGRQP